MQSIISSTGSGVIEIEGLGSIGGSSERATDTIISKDDTYDGKLSESIKHHSSLELKGTTSQGHDVSISLSFLEERHQSSKEIYEGKGFSTHNMATINAQGKSERLSLKISSDSGINDDELKQILASATQAFEEMKYGGFDNKSAVNIAELFSETFKSANITLNSQDNEKYSRALNISISDNKFSGRILANDSNFEADKPHQLFTPKPTAPAKAEPIVLDISKAEFSLQDMLDNGFGLSDEQYSELGVTAEDYLKLRDIK